MTRSSTNANIPVKLVEFRRDKTTPLRRAMEVYAHRAQDIDAPFEIIELRKRQYVLVCFRSFPHGWHSQIVQYPSPGHSARCSYYIDGYYNVAVTALALKPGDSVVVEGVCRRRNCDQTPLTHYVYTAPAAPTK